MPSFLVYSGGGGDDDYGLSSSTSILIQGMTNLNRAVNGDKVAIEIFDKSKWNRPSNLLVVESGEDKEDEAAEHNEEIAEGFYFHFIELICIVIESLIYGLILSLLRLPSKFGKIMY